jgi:hypothetical protein
MRLQRLLESRPTTTAWLLEPGAAVAVRRDRKQGLVCSRVALPPGVVEVGSVGLQGVDRQRLAELVSPLQERVLGIRRAAVVVPTAWVRIHLMDFDHLPRRSSELTEVVRWRLKKLLPVAPSELRIALVPLHAGGSHQVLCVSGLERSFADLEAAFAGVDVEPGLITPRLFALARRARSSGGPQLVVQHEAGFLSLLLTVEGRPRLLRTKPLPPTEEAWALTLHELHLALSYIRDTLEIGSELEVTTSADSDAVEESLRQWWSEQEGVRADLEPLPPCSSTEGGELEVSRLRLALSVLHDGERE